MVAGASPSPSLSHDDTHFTPANLPYGIASTKTNPQPRVATRLYGTIYFISDLITQGLLPDLPAQIPLAIHDQTTLNALAALPKPDQHLLRSSLSRLLTPSPANSPATPPNEPLTRLNIPATSATMHLPIAVGDFTDFSCSRQHVLNAGEAVLGERAVPPAFAYFPIGYTGRTSSIAVSGTPVRRPWGMVRARAEDGGGVVFRPSRAVDFELEVAAVVGRSTRLGERVKVEDADEAIFGFVLLNDWSARDIQGLEMAPLGPLNGKSFGTSISPWIVPLEALSPFKCAPTFPPQPTRAAYLHDPDPRPHYAVQLQLDLIPNSRPSDDEAHTICRSRLEWLEYTFRDLVVHQSVNGCPLRTGDLLATGTVSGAEAGHLGCLLEITGGGKRPLELCGGERPTYLEDGDGVRLTGWAGELGSAECVGFGECVGVLLAAHVENGG